MAAQTVKAAVGDWGAKHGVSPKTQCKCWLPNSVMERRMHAQAAAAQAPPMNISITVMTPKQFVEGFNGSIANCTWRGRPLKCAFRPYSNDSGGHAAYLAAGKAPPLTSQHSCPPALPVGTGPCPLIRRAG